MSVSKRKLDSIVQGVEMWHLTVTQIQPKHIYLPRHVVTFKVLRHSKEQAAYEAAEEQRQRVVYTSNALNCLSSRRAEMIQLET